jgi:hypothetical protein
MGRDNLGPETNHLLGFSKGVELGRGFENRKRVGLLNIILARAWVCAYVSPGISSHEGRGKREARTRKKYRSKNEEGKRFFKMEN